MAGQLVTGPRPRRSRRAWSRRPPGARGGLRLPPTRAELTSLSPAELAARGLSPGRASALARLLRTVDVEALRGTTRRRCSPASPASAAWARGRRAWWRCWAWGGSTSAWWATSGLIRLATRVNGRPAEVADTRGPARALRRVGRARQPPPAGPPPGPRPLERRAPPSGGAGRGAHEGRRSGAERGARARPRPETRAVRGRHPSDRRPLAITIPGMREATRTPPPRGAARPRRPHAGAAACGCRSRRAAGSPRRCWGCSSSCWAWASRSERRGTTGTPRGGGGGGRRRRRAHARRGGAAVRYRAQQLMSEPLVIVRDDAPDRPIRVARSSLGARPQIRRAVEEALEPPQPRRQGPRRPRGRADAGGRIGFTDPPGPGQRPGGPRVRRRRRPARPRPRARDRERHRGPAR